MSCPRSAPFRPSSDAQLYPIRQLELNKELLKVKADEKMSEAEKNAKLAQLQKGIDEIACTSVNDAFVMGHWNQAQGSEDITMLADGNGLFAKAVGLEMDASKFGMGQRSQRYSMVVSDGIVEQLNVEEPGEYKASSAEHMLEQL